MHMHPKKHVSRFPFPVSRKYTGHRSSVIGQYRFNDSTVARFNKSIQLFNYSTIQQKNHVSRVPKKRFLLVSFLTSLGMTGIVLLLCYRLRNTLCHSERSAVSATGGRNLQKAKS